VRLGRVVRLVEERGLPGAAGHRRGDQPLPELRGRLRRQGRHHEPAPIRDPVRPTRCATSPTPPRPPESSPSGKGSGAPTAPQRAGRPAHPPELWTSSTAAPPSRPGRPPNGHRNRTWPAALRGRALLLVGLVAVRRSELTALTLDQVAEHTNVRTAGSARRPAAITLGWGVVDGLESRLYAGHWLVDNLAEGDEVAESSASSETPAPAAANLPAPRQPVLDIPAIKALFRTSATLLVSFLTNLVVLAVVVVCAWLLDRLVAQLFPDPRQRPFDVDIIISVAAWISVVFVALLMGLDLFAHGRAAIQDLRRDR